MGVTMRPAIFSDLRLAEDRATTMTRTGKNPGPVVALCLAVALASAGCGTTTIEDAVPTSATSDPAPQAELAQAGAPAAPAAPFARPGDYPNLNVVPQPAAEQITPAEKQSDTQRLRTIRSQQAQEGRDAARYRGSAADLRRIARTHAAEALKQIEGE